MAERLGLDAEAEHWFVEGLKLTPDDFYMRTAYSDLLLREGRNTEVPQLLHDYHSMEPMLLRIAIAERRLGGAGDSATAALLANAFTVEEQRGDSVHRREQARFLLNVEQKPQRALTVAQQNWSIQREPDDALIFVRAAQAAGQPDAATPAVEFIRAGKLEDVSLSAYTVDGP